MKFKWTKKNKDAALVLVGLVLTAASLGTSIWAILEARMVAKNSGSLDKADIRFGFGDQLADFPEMQVLAVIPDQCRAEPILMELPFTVFNAGNKGAQEVSVVMTFPLIDGASPVVNSDINDMMRGDSPPVASVMRTVTDTPSRRHVSYRVSALYPKMLVGLGEPIQAPLPVSVAADGMLVTAEYSLEVPLNITFDGASLETGKLHITAVRGKYEPAKLAPVISRLASSQAQATGTGGWRGWLARQVGWLPATQVFILTADEYECGSADGSFAFTRNVRTATVS